jgi:exodeoxyribonuclease V gamma subunit
VSPKITFFFGNHLETLASALARLLRLQQSQPAADPLRPEVVLVQSKGMQRWLSMAIARHNGICANVEFPFPNAFLENTCHSVLGPSPEKKPFDPQVLAFRIMGWLDELLPHGAFLPIRDYLSGSGGDVKGYQLSNKIADVFDQYMVFRPEMIRAWESLHCDGGPEDAADWQAILWSKLTASTELPHRAALQNRLVRRLKQTTQPIEGLPERVSVFGISYLPPFHLEVLDALSRRIPVNAFMFNPCREFWSDIVSERHLIRQRSRLSRGDDSLEDLHFEKGNRLLASWGRQGRQFFSMLHQIEGQQVELFEENSSPTLLCDIQQDILDLVDRPAVHPRPEPRQSDGSVRIHACHSAMREVEVLYDQLIDIMETDPDIGADDVMIMTPDIATYAPLIHGVFGSAAGDSAGRIPFAVADQPAPRESRVVQAFLALLDLRYSRFEASKLLQLLQFSCIRSRFDLLEAHLPLIERWIADVNIRWGWNGHDRSKHGLPRFNANTWRTGLDRLLLGTAIQTQKDSLVAGLLPHEDGIEGADSRILGHFVRFAETLYNTIDSFPERASMSAWPRHLGGLIDACIQAEEGTERDIELLRSVMDKMEQIAASIDRETPLSFDTARQLVHDSLERSSYGGGFLTGGVTFCAMLPMRSIPAKVIGLLGMQHDAFPRDDREPGFNKMAEAPKVGDRSTRDDDKYLFLEALLSARRVFYISYIGRDIQDNAPIPPAVLVSELVEYASEGFGIPERELFVEQPLQAFSPRYFMAEHQALFSYSEENCHAARQLHSPQTPPPFFQGLLPEPEAEARVVDLGALVQFYSHPSKYLLENRLGIRPRSFQSSSDDRENFNLNGLEQFLTRQAILNGRLQDPTLPDRYALLNAAGCLPHGASGKAAYDRLSQEVSEFMATLSQYEGGARPSVLPIDYQAPPFRMIGQIDGIYPGGRVWYRLAKLRPQDLLSCHIVHLALVLNSEADVACRSTLLCKDQIWQFEKTEMAREHLDALLALYWKGMQYPLAIYPRCSFEYAFQRIVKGKTRAQAIAAGRRRWNGGYFKKGECDDVYLNLAFGQEDPFTGEFEDLSIQIYSPLFEGARLISDER